MSSKILCYFTRPSHPSFKNMKILDYFKDYRLKPYTEGDPIPNHQFLKELNALFPCKRVLHYSVTSKTVCQLQIISPKASELFYLHSLLLYILMIFFEN